MRILLVDDDEKLCDSLSFELKKSGFLVDCCQDGAESLLWVRQNAYDLLILDRMLPGLSGIQVLEALRREGNVTPVILLTALGEIRDRVTGLEAGADDYLVKPFAFEELLARIHSLSRRPHTWSQPEAMRLGDIAFDAIRASLSGPKGTLSLSPREGELLEFFLRNIGQTLPRTLLLSRVWGLDSEVEEGNLDNYIHFLRKRLRAVGSRLTLRTIRSIGYVLEDSHV